MAEPFKLSELRNLFIAGYPPWYANALFAASGITTAEAREPYLLLMRSIEDGKPEETRRLLNSGLNPNAIISENDGTLLEWAVEKAKNSDCLGALLEAGADVSSPRIVWRAVRPGHEAFLTAIFKAGANPNTCSDDSVRPLALAVAYGYTAIVQLLLDAGADVNISCSMWVGGKQQHGCTALMLAALGGKPPLVKLLLNAGADPNWIDSAGNSVMAWAKACSAKSKSAKVIALLEKAGASTISAAAASALATPDFRQGAKSDDFQRALVLAKKITGAAPKSVQLADGPLPGAKGFSLRNENSLDLLDQVRREIQPLPVFAFLTHNQGKMGIDSLVLLPTTDVYEAITAFETPEGQRLTTSELIGWLKDLQRRRPFEITHIAADLIRARFFGDLDNPLELAREIEMICHDVINEPLSDFAAAIQRTRELYLWWD